MPTETQTTDAPVLPPVPPVPPPPVPPPPPCSATYVEALNEDAARVNYKFRYVWNFLANFHDQLLAKFESYQWNLACKLDFQEWYRIIRDLMDSYKYLMMTGGDCIGLLGPNTHTRPDCHLLIQMYELEIPDKEAKVDEFYAEAVRLTNPRGALGGGWKLCGEVLTEPPTPIGQIPPMTPPPTIAPLPVVQPPVEPPPTPAPTVVTRPLPGPGTQVTTTDPVTATQTVVITVPPADPVVTVIPGPPTPALNQPAQWELCIGALEHCNTKRDELITLMDQYLDAFAEHQGWLSNKMDTFDLNSECWKLYDFWYRMATDEKDTYQKIFDLKLNSLPLANWDCPNNTTWQDKYEDYLKKLKFIEDIVEQMGSLNRRVQRLEYVKDAPYLCPEAVSMYYPPMQEDPGRSTCFLTTGATRNLYLAQIARINATNLVISDKQKQLYKTRNTYAKNTPCWKFFEAWFQACKTVYTAADAAIDAIATGIDWNIDCTFDGEWEAKDKVNAAKVAALKAFVDSYEVMATNVTTVGPEGFNDCDNKNPL